MKFHYDRPSCQNLRRVLRREWLETNGLGDYASSSLVCCNTRKYHGLFVTELARPAGRHVLLSTLEESICMAGREFFISCRKHPGVYHPRGHEYMQEAQLGPWPRHRYRFGDVFLTREIMLLPGRHVLLVRYLAECDSPDVPPLTLRLKPLLACRNMHAVRRESGDVDMRSSATLFGASVRPSPELPELFLQVEGNSAYTPAPDWYRTIEYLVEQERGFAWQENLIMPGVFEIAIKPGEAVYFTASTESLQKEHGRREIGSLWEQAAGLRLQETEQADTLQRYLALEGRRFLVRMPADGARPAPARRALCRDGDRRELWRQPRPVCRGRRVDARAGNARQRCEHALLGARQRPRRGRGARARDPHDDHVVCHDLDLCLPARRQELVGRDGGRGRGVRRRGRAPQAARPRVALGAARRPRRNRGGPARRGPRPQRGCVVSHQDFLVFYLSVLAVILACRCVPLLALNGRELSPRVSDALALIPPAAFAALVVNDLFDPAAGLSWRALLAAALVVAVARRTGSLIWCALTGMVAYALLTLVP